jgi:hypothetical protein
VLLVARSSGAEAPPPSETKPLKPAIEALKNKPSARAALASARWYVEVLGGESVSVYVGGTPETIAYGAVGPAEAEIANRDCGPLTPKELKAASAILAEFGEQLPLTLRAYTLGSQGKTDEGAQLFASWVEGQMPLGPCPGEHPLTSGRRIRQMSFGLRCVEKFAPKRDVSKLKLLIKRAEECANTNHAVG